MIAILFENCDIEKRKISKTYKNEILKIDIAYKSKILSIYDQRPGFYHHMKKIKISSLNTSKNAISY